MNKKTIALILPLSLIAGLSATSPTSFKNIDVVKLANRLEGFNITSISDADSIFAKAKTFTNIKTSKFDGKDTEREDHITYKRYPNYYLLSGEADSNNDAYDKTSVIGYVGFPQDGSIDMFYDVLKSTVDVEHAKAYTIPFNKAPEKANEISEKDAYKKLDDYENNLIHFIDETYEELKTNTEVSDIDSIMVGKKQDGELTKLKVTAYKYTTILGTSIKADYELIADISSTGAISNISFNQYFNDDFESPVSIQSLQLEYGDYYSPLNDLGIYDPTQYFVQSINPSVYDVWVNSKSETNKVSVNSTFTIQPRYPNSPQFDFTYSPTTAVDEWDISFLGSSNKDVIELTTSSSEYGSTSIVAKAKKVGKSILTIGSIYNPYVNNYQLEVEVVNAAPTSISVDSPYSKEDYTATAYLNSDVVFSYSVNPYPAVQQVKVTSSDESILKVRINAKNKIVVSGKKVGSAYITITSVADEKIKKTISFIVKDKLDSSIVLGSWKAESLYQFYGIKFKYSFKNDFTGSMSIISKGYDGDEEVSFNFSYYLDYSTKSVIITPNDRNIAKNLSIISIQDSQTLIGHCTIGEYENIPFSIVKE